MDKLKNLNQRIQNGSATIEMVVLGAVMVPMIAIAPLLGKMTDVSHAAVQSARYTVWERSVFDSAEKSEDALATEVHNRFFSAPDQQVLTGQGVLTGNEAMNDLWIVRPRDGEEASYYVSGAEDIFIGTQNNAVTGAAGALLSGQISNVGQAMSRFNSGADWDLDSDGLYTANVGINVARNSFQSSEGTDCNNQSSDTVATCLRRSHTMLVDTWDARSSSEVVGRVKAFVPAGAFQPVAQAAAIVAVLPVFQELAGLGDALGSVEPDVLPPDRYGEIGDE